MFSTALPELEALALALLASSAGQDPEWLVVRGKADQIGTLSYERIAAVYLGPFEKAIVTGAAARASPATSRLVIGTPEDNELVAELAPELGLEFEDGAAIFQGRRYGGDVGLVLVQDDLDGQGRLSVLTGATPQGVFACFTVPLDVTQPGLTIVRQGKAERGLLFPVEELRRPVVVRLDQDVERLLAATEGWPASDRAVRLARGLEGHVHVYRAMLGAQVDLLALARATVDAVDDAAGDAGSRKGSLAGRDVDHEILDAFARCRAALGGEERPAPVFYVIDDPRGLTNGRTFGPDPVTRRSQVGLNLAVLARDGNLEAVVLHESAHTFQTLDSRRLVDRAVIEGVATLVSQTLAPSLTDAQALLWKDAQLAAAVERRAELVAAFAREKETLDPARQSAWLDLDGALDSVRGAPSRSGYYVGWLAARAWRDAHAGRSLSELIAASPDEILAALD